ncbi:MAG: ABC transporter permease [Burkholderiaceae bacterium]
MSRSIVTRLGPSIAALALLNATPPAHAQGGSIPESSVMGLCGTVPAPAPSGPWDYRTATREQRTLVESFHFTHSVETLSAGATGAIGGDLDYTLNKFPNHLRALSAMMRLSEKTRSMKPAGAKYPVECYFDRALRFAPNDAQVRALYGFYLIQGKREKEARIQLTAAEQLGPPDAQLAYNLGLAYFDLREYDKSLAFAKQAYAAGISVPGLRKKLTDAGKWH